MRKFWPYLLLLLANLIYGLNFSIAKMVMPDFVKPLGFVLMRAASAMLFFVVLGTLTTHQNAKKFTPNEWVRLLACAFFGVALNQLCFFEGLELTAPISASVIMTIVPVVVLVLSYFVLHYPITPIKLLGVLVGMMGALIMIFSEDHPKENASNPILGNTLVFINACSYSVYLVLVKPLLSKYPPLRILKWLFLFGFFMILPFGWSEFTEVHFAELPPKIIWAILFVLIFVSCLTYLFNLSALQKVNPSTVSIFIYSQPVFAILYSLWMQNDQLSILKVIGASCIFVGVYFVTSSNFNRIHK